MILILAKTKLTNDGNNTITISMQFIYFIGFTNRLLYYFSKKFKKLNIYYPKKWQLNLFAN